MNAKLKPVNAYKLTQLMQKICCIGAFCTGSINVWFEETCKGNYAEMNAGLGRNAEMNAGLGRNAEMNAGLGRNADSVAGFQ